MKYIKDLHDGERVACIYMVKSRTSLVTKNGKPYDSVILQDRTGTIDCKIWDPNDPGISEFDKMDYIDVVGDVSIYNGALQMSIKRARTCREGEYDPSDYLPTSSKNIEDMYGELTGIIASIKDPYYKKLLDLFFVEDEEFIRKFKKSSAAKSVHHAFIGGLLEHTLSVTKLCDYYTTTYPILNRDLLLTAAICHDIAKTKELSQFPENDYTDEGQLLGHIVMGAQMVREKSLQIPDFPTVKINQLEHCILAHHGKLEYGSPKMPSLIEATALNYADDTDAKMETFREILEKNQETKGWLGFQKFVDNNVRATL